MRRPFAVLLAFALLAAACGDDEPLSVENAWARTSPRMAGAGAVYLDLTSAGGDRLIGASVAPSIAGMVQIHETVMVEMEGQETGEGMGAMQMQEVGQIDLPAGETVSLEPGGLHIMLMQLSEPLEVGQTFDVSLTFEEAGEIVVGVEVRDEEP